MTRRWNALARKIAPMLGAGVLLQTGGCNLEPAGLAQELVTAIANNLITSLVFGVFNLPVPGGF